MRDETEGDAMETVDTEIAEAAQSEPDHGGLDVTEEWPQLTPLELAVCLADSERASFFGRTDHPG
jgi:hypothetical protein